MSDKPETESAPEQSQSEEQTTTPTETEGGTALGSAPVERAPFDPESLTLPEGMEEHFTDEDKQFVSDFAQRHDMPHAAVEEMIETYFARLAEARDSVSSQVDEAWNTLTQQWYSELEQAYGNADKIQETADKLAPLLNEFGTPELRQALDMTGMGNNPEMFKFLEKVADAIGEAKPVSGGTPAGEGGGSAYERAYPSMKG